jgi:hypothetical protein
MMEAQAAAVAAAGNVPIAAVAPNPQKPSGNDSHKSRWQHNIQQIPVLFSFYSCYTKSGTNLCRPYFYLWSYP